MKDVLRCSRAWDRWRVDERGMRQKAGDVADVRAPARLKPSSTLFFPRGVVEVVRTRCFPGRQEAGDLSSSEVLSKGELKKTQALF